MRLISKVPEFTKIKNNSAARQIEIMVNHAQTLVVKEDNKFVFTAEIKKFSFESILSMVLAEAMPRLILTSSSFGFILRANS